MARIAGINIPTHKHIVIGLQSIFGIGETRSKQICETLKLDPTTKVSALTEGELEEIRGVIAQFQVEGGGVVQGVTKLILTFSAFAT